VIRIGAIGSSGSVGLIFCVVSRLDESSVMIGISSLLLDRRRLESYGLSGAYEGIGVDADPFRVFVREDRVAARRESDDSLSSTNELLSGS
jgi:hypothetical protein